MIAGWAMFRRVGVLRLCAEWRTRGPGAGCGRPVCGPFIRHSMYTSIGYGQRWMEG